MLQKKLVGTLNDNLRAQKRDVYPFNFKVNFDKQYLKKGGGNVVVVWPVGFLQITPDSTKDKFFFDDLDNVSETELPNLSIFPNPAQDVLTISNVSTVEDVRLYDALGRDVSIKLNGNTVPISNLNAGTYHIRVTLKNGLVYTAPILIARN